MPILKKCCFCIPLTTGAVAIGTLYFIWFCFVAEELFIFLNSDVVSWYWWMIISFLIANVTVTIMLIYASVKVGEIAQTLELINLCFYSTHSETESS